MSYAGRRSAGTCVQWRLYTLYTPVHRVSISSRLLTLELTLYGVDHVDGEDDDGPADGVELAAVGDEECPEESEAAVEDQPEPEAEDGDTAALERDEDGEEEEEVGDLVVEMVERSPGGAELMVVLEERSPVRPGLEDRDVGHVHHQSGHRLLLLHLVPDAGLGQDFVHVARCL